MIKEKKISLKVETFPNGEEKNYLIHSHFEIQNILQTICERNTQSAVYFDEGKNFFLTILLAANEKGFWIDPSSRSMDNRHLLNSEEIIFVSAHNQTKIQFAANAPWQVQYENNPAIFFPLPQTLLRLQRRDFYRLSAEPQHPLECVLKPAKSREQIISVKDISVGGLSLEYPERELELTPGAIYTNCEIDLPEIGTLTATIQVKNTFRITTRSGKVNQHAGCVFVKPDHKVTMPLQRYVAQMQRISATTNFHR